MTDSGHDTDVLISADSHVGETKRLRDRLPEEFRGLMQLVVPSPHEDITVYMGDEVFERPMREPSAADRELEFRDDPSLGTDLGRRRRDMAREGVDAQVVFPNIALDGGGGTAPLAFNETFARAYNDYVFEIFEPDRERFKPAAMVSVDDVDEAVRESRRSIERGFATIFLPCVVPWQPYWLDVYEPLWSLVEEAGIPLTFHVFAGNLAMGGEYADVADLSDERFESAKKHGKHRREESPERLETVVGMAAGMNPILELTGSGVLERHPGLRFVVTERECGWLSQPPAHFLGRELQLRAGCHKAVGSGSHSPERARLLAGQRPSGMISAENSSRPSSSSFIPRPRHPIPFPRHGIEGHMKQEDWYAQEGSNPQPSDPKSDALSN